MTVARRIFSSEALATVLGGDAPAAVEAIQNPGFPALLVWSITLAEAQPAGSITLRVSRSNRGLTGVRGTPADAHVFTFGHADGPDIQPGAYIMAVPLVRHIHGFGALPAESFVMAETEISEGPATLADCSLTMWRVPAPRTK